MADLTDKQKVWLETYLTCWNATEAARQAGYAFPNVEGPKNLVNPSLAEVVKSRIAEKAMTADEVLIRLGEQARSTMDDFLILRPVRVTPTVTRPVGEVIAALAAQVEFEEEYADRAGLEGKEMEAHTAEMARIRRRILRLQIRLERDPDATEDVPGPTIEQMVPDIDLAKATERDKLHLVKSYNAKDGKVELYDAHAALVDIGKHHGLFKDVTEVQLDWDKLSEDELQRIRNGEDPRKVIRER